MSFIQINLFRSLRLMLVAGVFGLCVGATPVFASTVNLETGTTLPNTTIYPGAAATSSSAFTFTTDTGTTSINSVTVFLGTSTGIALVEITSADGTIVYGSTTNPTLSSVTITLNMTTLIASTTPTEYCVRITPKSHVAMPVPAGGTYTYTTRVTDWVGGVTGLNSDLSITQMIVDNTVPSFGSWAMRTPVVNNAWQAVTYGNGLFVAVSGNGSGNRVMTSPNGITWTSRTSASNSDWRSVIYGNGLFVAVGSNAIMTSSDGITWTSRTSPAANGWNFVTYGNGLFVAVGSSGTGNGVMTSSNGIAWTARTSVADNYWKSVTYGNGLFVAVCMQVSNDPCDTLMTSPDGITWTGRAAAATNYWRSVAFGSGVFVAVGGSGLQNFEHEVMTSFDGANWTLGNTPEISSWLTWNSVTYGNGLFVAVSYNYNRIMTSPDGFTWTLHETPVASNDGWYSVAYGNGVFVATAYDYYGNGESVMSSFGLASLTPTSTQVTVSYTTPPDTDYHSTLILMSTSTAVIDTPVEGVTYALHQWIGSSTVACLDTTGVAATSSSCVVSGLTNDTEYHFAVFNRDQGGNYSLGSVPVGSPTIPGAFTVSLNIGTILPNTTIYPGAAATSSSAFTFTTDTGTTSINSVTVFLGTSTGIALVEITSADGTIVYGSTTNPTLSSVTITLNMTTLIASTTPTEYRVRITPKSHVAMPVPAGGTYTYTTRVTDWVGNGIKIKSDTSTSTLTVDNSSVARGDVWSPGSLPYNWWNDIVYGNGLFVAVNDDTFTQRVATTPDGITWTQRAASARSWSGVTYGNGLFVAVACGSSTFCNETNANRVMTSPDGITWTARTTPGDTLRWSSVTYGNGLFVAVSTTGTGNRVMTSPDGTTWTLRTSAADYSWNDILYANGLFVAVAGSGSGNRVMTSPDGITWTLRTTPANNAWESLIYGNDLFVAVASSGSGNRVMTSPDGITWTARASAADNGWTSISYGGGVFVAVSNANTGVMVSANGFAWELRTPSERMSWNAVAYGSGRFVAVSNGSYTTSGRKYTMSSFGLASLTPTSTQVTVSYTTPPDTDYHSTLILMSTSTAVIDTPVEGVTYALHQWIGSSTVACLDTTGVAATSSSCVVSGLTNDTEYHFAVFNRDQGGNYSLGSVPVGSPTIPGAFTVSLNIGTILPNTTIYPGAAATSSSAFTFTTDTGTTSINSVTVFLGTSTGIALVEITSADGTIVYGSTTNPTLSSVTITLNMTTLIASTTPTEYRVRITPKSHVAMPVPAGGTYTYTTRVTDWVGAGMKVRSDLSTTVVAVDNEVPHFGSWKTRAATAANRWRSVTYGNGIFVAVSDVSASNSTAGQVMTSPDGVNWTARNSAVYNGWHSITYGNGLFVAVSYSWQNNGVMTSPDGVTWTTRAGVDGVSWASVTYGNGLFVAVSNNAVMTSPNGITWTSRTAAADKPWSSVTYGNGVFVAISDYGTGDRVMTSPDGITWTSRTAATDNGWYSVTYGNGLFVAVGYASIGNTNNVMTSPDGITWTLRSSAADTSWTSITHKNGLFLVLGNYGSGSGNTMTSPDGIIWTASIASLDKNWKSVTYGNGVFVAVCSDDNFGDYCSTLMSSFGLASLTPTSTQVTVSYTTPPDTDYHSTLILMSTSTAVIDTPVEGVTYALHQWIGSSTVACLDTTGVAATSSSCVVSGLTNDTEYHFAVFNRDQGGNYSLGSVPVGSPTIPGAFTVSLNIGTILPNTTIYPGAAATSSSAFTFTTDTGTTSINSVTVFLGTSTGIALVEITSADGTIVYGSTTNPTLSSVTITLNMTTLIASTTPTEYRVRITPKSHVAMPVPAGGTYTYTTRVTDWVGAGMKVRSDLSTTQIDVDNASPAGFSVTTFPDDSLGFWYNIAYADGLFVAVGDTGDRVMTSPDGINWTPRSAAGNDDSWYGITYGNGLFVAVGDGNGSGGGDMVMTSPDGINWTPRSAAGNDDSWYGIAYANSLFVVVGNYGDRVMTSPDGINWTPRSAAGNDDNWLAITYGNGLFVAVAWYGADRVMTSPDGINWTPRSAAGNDDAWHGISFGNSIFVAVSNSGDRVMTSPDGITWTVRSAAGNDDYWQGITYANDLFIVVGTGADRVMASPDGIDWMVYITPEDGSLFNSIISGNGIFVAVGEVDVLRSSPASTTLIGDTATINYSTPDNIDYHSTIVLMSASVITTAPTEGVTYNISDTIGSSTVVCVNNDGIPSATSSCVIGGVTSDPHYFAIFTQDNAGNYSVGVIPEGTPLNAPSTLLLTFLHYRFRDDYGTESSASYLAPEDTPLTLANNVYLGDRKRVRTTVVNDGSSNATNITYRLEYASSSCNAWIPVPSYNTQTTEEWVMDLSQWIPDGAPTTHSSGMSAPDGKSFTPGQAKLQTNQTSAHTLTSTQYTEHEYVMRSTSYAQKSLTYCFRLSNAGSIADFIMSVQPQIILTPALRPQYGGMGIESIGSGVFRTGGAQNGGTSTEPVGTGVPHSGGSQGGGGGNLE